MDLLRKVIRLAIVLAIAHAAWRVIPVYLNHVQFKDDVREIARFSGGRTEKEIRDLVLEQADRLQIPVDPASLVVAKRRTTTAIDASYVQPLELLPKYFYDWQFDVAVDVLHARPATPEQIP
jgi:hypothetical protein